jgi:hypothetical protein
LNTIRTEYPIIVKGLTVKMRRHQVDEMRRRHGKAIGGGRALEPHIPISQRTVEAILCVIPEGKNCIGQTQVVYRCFRCLLGRHYYGGCQGALQIPGLDYTLETLGVAKTSSLKMSTV